MFLKTKTAFQYYMVYAEPETLREMEAKSKEYLESKFKKYLLLLVKNTNKLSYFSFFLACTLHMRQYIVESEHISILSTGLCHFMNWYCVIMQFNWAHHEYLVVIPSSLKIGNWLGFITFQPELWTLIVMMEHRKWWVEKTYSSFSSIICKGDQ